MTSGMTALQPATVQDLWAQVRALTERAAQEGSPVDLRRALVMLAVAGSGAAVPAYVELVEMVDAVARRLGMDPVPLFDAAAALVAFEDEPAREALVTVPRRLPASRPPASFRL